jgi:hypothetical protein
MEFTNGDLGGTVRTLADASLEEVEATFLGRDRRSTSGYLSGRQEAANPAPPTSTPTAVGHFESVCVPARSRSISVVFRTLTV